MYCKLLKLRLGVKFRSACLSVSVSVCLPAPGLILWSRSHLALTSFPVDRIISGQRQVQL